MDRQKKLSNLRLRVEAGSGLLVLGCHRAIDIVRALAPQKRLSSLFQHHRHGTVRGFTWLHAQRESERHGTEGRARTHTSTHTHTHTQTHTHTHTHTHTLILTEYHNWCITLLCLCICVYIYIYIYIYIARPETDSGRSGSAHPPRRRSSSDGWHKRGCS